MHYPQCNSNTKQRSAFLTEIQSKIFLYALFILTKCTRALSFHKHRVSKRVSSTTVADFLPNRIRNFADVTIFLLSRLNEREGVNRR